MANEFLVVSHNAERKGDPVNLGRYFLHDNETVSQVIRPSEALNAIINVNL